MLLDPGEIGQLSKHRLIDVARDVGVKAFEAGVLQQLGPTHALRQEITRPIGDLVLNARSLARLPLRRRSWTIYSAFRTPIRSWVASSRSCTTFSRRTWAARLSTATVGPASKSPTKRGAPLTCAVSKAKGTNPTRHRLA